ncbi:Protein FAR1-RELATED SEQUENCE [Abeliophyllum distichum]|uniref:Protein FAR1-RELATED SEQUENCE n=1 Tax=Abeliophyllum distichum TaxID=126358 RepID=A0ABD1RD92_9LAMI
MNVVLYNDQYHRLVHIIKQSESPAEFEQQWIKFNRALVHQRHEELAANHIDLSQRPKVTTALMIENQMVQIYTKKIFLLFQNELVQSNSYTCSKRSSSDEGKVYAVQRFEPGRTSDRIRHRMLSYATSDLVDDGSLTDARSTFLLSEFQSLQIRVKDIDTGDDVGMSRNKNKSREETQVVRDPNPVRAKECGKRLKSEKGESTFAIPIGSATHVAPMITIEELVLRCKIAWTTQINHNTSRIRQTNSITPLDPQYAYHALDSPYAYAPDSQYKYHAPDPHYAYHAPDPQYAYHAPDPRYSITDNNNASYSLDPHEYDARFNPRH